MNISFDLDNTLIPHGNVFETEKRNLIGKLLGIEKIRKGTCELIRQLKNDGHNIHIYTTSYRTRRKVKLTFRYYGVKVDRVVNQIQNERTLKLMNINSSKYPPAFNFDLHIDDSKGVEIEAERYNFNTIIVSPDDKEWGKKIRNEIKRWVTRVQQ
ncbi:MAG: hypothetical protein A2W99_03805 [Bacteroidetes bacterium GWF2_33_16]|nr:MAG: hypothetical protein A2X00_12215 [Bacteroidetes bacterium GWE2_32_14]OFY02308.1 MAG: hypothetical protein A2W99_03805 [Bacteroidetes bacterium GWF2_33_16]